MLGLGVIGYMQNWGSQGFSSGTSPRVLLNNAEAATVTKIGTTGNQQYVADGSVYEWDDD
jgi:hypothetical protein